MKRWIPRVALAVTALALTGVLVAASGIIPLKASSGHWALTEWFLKFVQRRSTATHSLGVDVPELGDPGLVLKGAAHYDFGCRPCHGPPDGPLPRIGQAMLPAPPDLAARVPESDARKLFHIVRHGLKFTGMPAWPAPGRDDEVWAVVAFLLKMPDLDPETYQDLVGGDPVSAPDLPALAPDSLSERTAGLVSRSCARCHGHDGLGRGSQVFPRLAGQRRDYLQQALAAYARGTRRSGTMEAVARGLDDETIRELGGYYAALEPGDPPHVSVADSEELERGRAIAFHGIVDRRVPACVECHDPAGRQARAAYPSLAGQPADYLELHLKLFKDGHRGGAEFAHLMDKVAPRLEPDEMRAVARYFESLRVDRP